MNRIKTSDVLDPSIQQPFTARSLDFLQDSNKDMVKGAVMNRIGVMYDPTKYYVVSGLYAYGTNQYSEGYIFFAGELYYCSGKISTAAIVNVLVLTIDTTTSAGSPYDPVMFTDNTNRSVHLQRRFVMSDAVSGSGTVNFSDCIFIDRLISFAPTLKAYNSSNVEVLSGFQASSYSYCSYIKIGNSVVISFSGGQFVIGSSVRTLTVSLPFTVTTPTNIYGSAIVGFQVAGGTTGFTGIAEIDNSNGVINIKRVDNNTDFPAIAANGSMYLNITGQIG